ncbi:hypothetical protein QF037_009126 [Streptomyces canus]|uniref:hypothetical protein n=1 Tax=Streptomyces canus TaxID=58343 RepID=UPI002787E093|nr:hypothetical protein [Streptomyces canus]MDQ0604781.1 hypothetical protein [Streptomyces canus]
MKQTELITGVGGEQGICRESGVRTVPGTGKRGWPAVPEAGLEATSQKYAHLTLTVNSRDLYQHVPSQDHTIHLFSRPDPEGDQTAHVHWLAHQVGGRFTGRMESAYL